MVFTRELLLQMPELPPSIQQDTYYSEKIRSRYRILEDLRQDVYEALADQDHELPPKEECPSQTLWELVDRGADPGQGRKTLYFTVLSALHQLTDRELERTGDPAIQQWRSEFDALFDYFPNQE